MERLRDVNANGISPTTAYAQINSDTEDWITGVHFQFQKGRNRSGFHVTIRRTYGD